MSTFAGLQKQVKSMLLVLMMVVLSLKGYSQDPGDNPDGPPPAVPLDDYLLPIILAAGAILAFFVFRRMNNKSVSH
jgi:hypothetical protein